MTQVSLARSTDRLVTLSEHHVAPRMLVFRRENFTSSPGQDKCSPPRRLAARELSHTEVVQDAHQVSSCFDLRQSIEYDGCRELGNLYQTVGILISFQQRTFRGRHGATWSARPCPKAT